MISVTEPDVLVVGGGVIGAVVLSAIARKGLRATLLERDRIGAGATGASGAMVRVFHTTQGLNDLALASFPDYLRFEEIYNKSCGFQRTGSLYFTDRASLGQVEREVARLGGAGASLEILTAREGTRRFPHFMWDEGMIAVHEPDAGHVDALGTTNAWLEDAREHGAEVVEGVAAQGWIVEGGAVRGVETSRGVLRAAVVVLAAGSWSTGLIRSLEESLGVHAIPAGLPRTWTGTIQTTDISWSDAMRMGLQSHPCFFDFRTRAYGRPRGDGRSIVGHGLSSGGPAQLEGDPAPDPRDSAETLSRLRSIAPVLGAGRVDGGVRSHDCFAEGWVPHVGSPVPGLVLAVGLSGGGFKIAPQVGREAAAHVERAVDTVRSRLVEETGQAGGFASMSEG